MNKGDLTQLVAQKAGITDAQAEKAVEVVLNQLKTRLPAPLGGQLDSFLEGGGGSPKLGDVAKGLGGMLGR